MMSKYQGCTKPLCCAHFDGAYFEYRYDTLVAVICNYINFFEDKSNGDKMTKRCSEGELNTYAIWSILVPPLQTPHC